MKKLFQLLEKLYTVFYIKKGLKDSQSLEPIMDQEIIDKVTPDSVALEKFKEVKRDDIIYAKRIDKRNPNRILSEGHKGGPFLVLENQGDKLLCVYGSSIVKKTQEPYILTTDNCNYDGLSKKTYFYIIDIYEINLETYIRKLNGLNEYDKHIFQKKINILARKKEFYKKYRDDFSLEQGDIFKYHKEQYFVYKLENNIITAIRISDIPNEYAFTSNNKVNYIYFDDVIEIKNPKGYLASDFVTQKIYNSISVRFQKYMEQQKRERTIQRGSIIQIEQDSLYIYSQEGELYLGYKIYPLSKNEKFPILIKQKKYSADFTNTYQINKGDSFEVVTAATEEEANHNREIKKLYNKMLKSQLEQTKTKIQKPNIKEGVIVSDRTLMHTEYIVLERNNNELLAIMLENNGIYFRYLDVRGIDFNRILSKKEFKDILIRIREIHSKYDRYISEKKLSLMIDKYSV